MAWDSWHFLRWGIAHRPSCRNLDHAKYRLGKGFDLSGAPPPLSSQLLSSYGSSGVRQEPCCAWVTKQIASSHLCGLGPLSLSQFHSDWQVHSEWNLSKNLKVWLNCKGVADIRFMPQNEKTTREKFRKHRSVVYVKISLLEWSHLMPCGNIASSTETLRP